MKYDKIKKILIYVHEKNMIANYDNREEIASNYSGYHCKKRNFQTRKVRLSEKSKINRGRVR